MYKERKGMGLDSPLMPNELSGYIFFLPSFSSSSSSPSLGKGDREMFDQCARKDLKKCISNYHVLVCLFVWFLNVLVNYKVISRTGRRR